MPTTTVSLSVLINRASKGYTVSDKVEHTSLVAMRDLKARGLSVRDIADAIAATGAKFAPAKSTVDRILKVVATLPEEFTYADYSTAYADANRARHAADEAKKAEKAAGTTGPSVPQGDTVPTVADLTSEQAVALLAELFTAHRDDAAFRDALLAHADTFAPIVLVATPVAA